MQTMIECDIKFREGVDRKRVKRLFEEAFLYAILKEDNSFYFDSDDDYNGALEYLAEYLTDGSWAVYFCTDTDFDLHFKVIQDGKCFDLDTKWDYKSFFGSLFKRELKKLKDPMEAPMLLVANPQSTLVKHICKKNMEV